MSKAINGYKSFYKGGCWTTATDELLLKATLLKGKEALESWHEWRRRFGEGKIAGNSFRLFPQLYKNLRDIGVENSQLQQYREAYKLVWFKNEVLFERAAGLLKSFEDAGIKTMMLKGSALAVFYYKDNGLRWMSDFDFLVPTEKVRQAADLLIKLNWEPSWLSVVRYLEEYLYTRHSHPFSNSSGQEIDLHWNSLFLCRYPCADDDFWQGAIPKKIRGVSTCILNPTDQFLHVCVHGVMSPDPAHLEWIADAAVIVNTSLNEIDWDRFVKQAQKNSLVPPVYETINYLKGLLGLAIPDKVLQDLQKIHVPDASRIRYELLTFPRGVRSYFIFFEDYSQRAGISGFWDRLLAFPRFLKLAWHLDSSIKIPGFIFDWYSRRIFKK